MSKKIRVGLIGYGFMGKHWDTFKEKDSTKSQQVGWMSPGMKKDTYGMKEFFDPIWTECLRVLKPGALAFVMSAPRSDVQSIMAQTLQEAGFDISFTPIYWTYASGFPKAMNVSKMLEKNGNQKEELDGSYGGFQPKPAVEVVLVAMKPIEEKGLLAQAQKNGKAVSWFDDLEYHLRKDTNLQIINQCQTYEMLVKNQKKQSVLINYLTDK